MQGKTKILVLCALALVGVLLISKPAITAVYSTPVRNVEDPARYPVQIDDGVTIPAGEYGAQKDIYTVPAGYRLVIDSVKATVSAGATAAVSVTFYGCTGSNCARLDVPLLWNDWNGSRYGVGTVMTRMYVDAGTTVTFIASRSTTTGFTYANQSTGFTGHLVPLP